MHICPDGRAGFAADACHSALWGPSAKLQAARSWAGSPMATLCVQCSTAALADLLSETQRECRSLQDQMPK
eukprot:3711081-Karenia_brevis.AAC.1